MFKSGSDTFRIPSNAAVELKITITADGDLVFLLSVNSNAVTRKLITLIGVQ